MEQTAVEWFAERIQSDKIFNFENVLKQAKEIEKEQMMQCYEDGYNRVAKLIEDATKQNGLTFKSE